MLWELRAEPLPGSTDSVLVEMRQVPGYLDFLAEIMPADVRRATTACVFEPGLKPGEFRGSITGRRYCSACTTRKGVADTSLSFFLAGVFAAANSSVVSCL